MAGESSAKRPKWEVADIFSFYGEQYRLSHSLPLSHLKVMHAVEVCRTAYLGGHLQRCDSCGFEKPSYNSCRNRHCPKCQTLTKAKWLEARKAELLSVGYFHNVFTLSHELNPVARCNQKVIFDILFRSVSETLLQFGENLENRLGGKLGFITILHTWDQTLLDHIHLHCVIPGGALSFDNSRWIPARADYLFNVKALSIVFREKFIDYLESAFESGKLIFPGETASLGIRKGFSRLIEELRKNRWVVYSKKPFAGAEQVLDYIGRYTHRVAISNNRIINIAAGNVTFTYRDRRKGSKLKKMTLKAEEFIRRFLLHVLPDRYVRIRHFGFLANRYKKDNIRRCQELMGHSQELPERVEKTTQELMLELTGVDITRCPCCKKGEMIIVKEISPLWERPVISYSPEPQYMDSS